MTGIVVANSSVSGAFENGAGASVAATGVCSTPQADSTAKVIKHANKITYKRFIILFLYHKFIGIRTAKLPS